MRLLRAGEPVKMSKRAGEFTTLRDVVEEVGRDPIRFMMIFRKNDAPLDFDFQKVTEQSKDNPVFYVQYAHARTASIFRQADAELPALAKDGEALALASFERLDDVGEMALIRRLAEYPRVDRGGGGGARAASRRLLPSRPRLGVPRPVESWQGVAAFALYQWRGCRDDIGSARPRKWH